jgi:hypothetical protein
MVLNGLTGMNGFIDTCTRTVTARRALGTVPGVALQHRRRHADSFW